MRTKTLSLRSWRPAGALLLFLVLLASCKTPQDITYFQDVRNNDNIRCAEAKIVTLQPYDQISIVVNSIEPKVAAMFNLPYVGTRIGTGQLSITGGVAQTGSQGICGYTVDTKGEIDFPFLGKLKVAGMTREALAEDLRTRLIASKQIKDPIVTVDYLNLGYSVIGEVARPGRYKLDRDRYTIMDALGQAGDLTLNGRRTDVTVLRHTGDKDVALRVDLTKASELYSSPAFYIQQGDVVYVAPTDKRKRESTVNGNSFLTPAMWISIASFLTTIVVLIVK